MLLCLCSNCRPGEEFSHSYNGWTLRPWPERRVATGHSTIDQDTGYQERLQSGDQRPCHAARRCRLSLGKFERESARFPSSKDLAHGIRREVDQINLALRRCASISAWRLHRKSLRMFEAAVSTRPAWKAGPNLQTTHLATVLRTFPGGATCRILRFFQSQMSS